MHSVDDENDVITLTVTASIVSHFRAANSFPSRSDLYHENRQNKGHVVLNMPSDDKTSVDVDFKNDHQESTVPCGIQLWPSLVIISA